MMRHVGFFFAVAISHPFANRSSTSPWHGSGAHQQARSQPRWVGQGERWDQILVADNRRVQYGSVHELSRPIKTRQVDARFGDCRIHSR